MRSIHIVSPTQGSIGEITKDLIKGLDSFFDITFEGESEPTENDILLCHFINPALIKAKEFNSFNAKVLIQPIDGTVIDKGVVSMLNQFDLIITPATAGRNIMIENGVTTPIQVVPNFYKEGDIVPFDNSIKQIPLEPFVFYHESTFHPRKGIEFLYEGFIRAFSDTEYVDRFLLVCKDNPFNKVTFDRIEKLKRDAIKLQSTYKNPANIIKISQKLEWSQLQALWARADAYVSFAKMEGFGIPLLRMAQQGKQILTLDAPCNGYLDFLNKDNCTLVPTTMTLATEEHMNLYTNETMWATPSMDDVIEGFRTVGHKLVYGITPSFNQEEIKKYEYSAVMQQYKKIFENL